MDFNYININQICSMRFLLTKKVNDFTYKSRRENKGFFGKIKIKPEGFYDSDDDLCTVRHIENSYYGNRFCKGKNVFRKPILEIRMSNDETQKKVFNSNREMFEFIFKSPLSKIDWVDMNKIKESRAVLLEMYKGYPDEYRILSKQSLETNY